MIAYEKALDWQELFDLAVLDGVEEEELVSMGYRVAGWSSLFLLIRVCTA